MNKGWETGAENVRWDLSFLYSGLDDPRLEEDLRAFEAGAAGFAASHKGRLSERLGDAIRDLKKLEGRSDKPMAYLTLRQSADQNDEAVKAKLMEAEMRLSRASAEHLAFLGFEAGDLADADLERLSADPEVAFHQPWLSDIRRVRKHLLTEEVESALGKRAPFGPGAWSDFFDEVEADLRFPWKGEERTLTEMLHVLSSSKDAEERAEALRLVNAGFGGHFEKTSAQALNQIVLAKATEDRERGYPHPMAARNEGNKMPDPVVEALHDAVRDVGGPLARRAYRLKAKLLGLPRLRWSDRNAPMPFSDDAVIPWEAARETVIRAYASFSPKLAGLVEGLFRGRRIDAPAAKGKRGGAFNYSFSLPDGRIETVVFLNYLGTNRDVMTLAHELGHAAHGLLAGEAQGPLQFHAPMAYAETASVFGEMVVFDDLRRRLEKEGNADALLALLMGKIDDMLNTAVRQIGFSNFERRVHGAGRRLSTGELGSAWLETARELYGPDGDVFTYENADRLWAYVSHFHRPFYVYSYACGELLTQSLYARKEEYGARFEPLYLDLLRAGGTKGAVELMKPFGLDPADPDFWKAGLETSLGRIIEEAEALAAER